LIKEKGKVKGKGEKVCSHDKFEINLLAESYLKEEYWGSHVDVLFLDVRYG
jgi:hypothetical protein